MLSNLKLSTIIWIIAGLVGLTIVIITVSNFIVERDVGFIDESWQNYQTDFSEKARLEGALRAAIGYNGMIHHYKNYVLRNDTAYKEQVISQHGAAIAILKQYKTLELSSAEAAAISDITAVLHAYKKALKEVDSLIAKNKSISTIDQTIRVIDIPAKRGLKVLRDEVISAQKDSHRLSKSRIVADLRAAMGYDGMIHKFKNYILRDQEMHDRGGNGHSLRIEFTNKVNQARESIKNYRLLTLNSSESLALADIEDTIKQYSDNIEIVHDLSVKNTPIAAIDNIVKVDDLLALRGFAILDTEIHRQLSENSENVTQSLTLVKQVIPFSKWVSVFVIISTMGVLVFLIHFYIILPISKISKIMLQLADNNLDIDTDVLQSKNEIGQMAKTISVFKKNMIQQKKAEHELIDVMSTIEKNELVVSSILNAVRDGIITINSKGIIEMFNPGAEDIFGYKNFEVIGKNISMLMTKKDADPHDSYLKRYLQGKSTRDQRQAMKQIALKKNGGTFPVEITLNTVKIDDEIKFTGVVRDITERVRWEEKIKHLAMTDALTGLANRNHFNNRFLEILHHSLRFNTLFSLLLIDLDKFKPVNDTYGHQVGDILLQKVSEVLLKSCREVDTVARLGGDEFTILLNGISNTEEAAIIAGRIIDQLTNPLSIENHDIQIGVSIGISCFPGDSSDIEELTRMADKALYASKQEGRNTYRYYSELSK